MTFISRYWPSLIIFLGGLLAAYGSFVSSKRNDDQQNVIKNTGDQNKILGENNLEFTKNIQNLQLLNNTISDNINILAQENKNISTDNLALTKQMNVIVTNVKNLTDQINSLTNQVYKEQTGGNSVPLISAKISYKPEIRYNRTPNDKHFLLKFHIENVGEYPIRSVSIRVYRWGHHVEEYHEPTEINQLWPNKAYTIEPFFDLGVPGNFSEGGINKNMEVIVKWKIEYTYRIQVMALRTTNDGGKFFIKETYIYKSQAFEKIADFLNNIKKDLE